MSEAEVLCERAKELVENNEECREDTEVVFVIVGERSGISSSSESPNTTSGEKTMALRWRPSEVELPRDLVKGGRLSGSWSSPNVCDGGSSSSASSGKASKPRIGESASGDGGHWILSKVSLTIGVCGNASRSA